MFYWQKKEKTKPKKKNKRGNSTSTVSTCHVYPVDLRTGWLHGSLVMTISRSDHVSTENGWKSVLLENVNCVNLNHFQLKWLIPIEHDLSIAQPFFVRINIPLFGLEGSGFQIESGKLLA